MIDLRLRLWSSMFPTTSAWYADVTTPRQVDGVIIYQENTQQKRSRYERIDVMNASYCSRDPINTSDTISIVTTQGQMKRYGQLLQKARCKLRSSHLRYLDLNFHQRLNVTNAERTIRLLSGFKSTSSPFI